MSIETLPIQHNTDAYLEPFFTDIKKIWYENNGGPGIEEILLKKTKDLKDGTQAGVFLIDNKVPKGMAWMEPTGEHYGSMLLHVLDKKYEHALAKAYLTSGASNGRLLELITFYKDHQYSDYLLQEGLHTLPRKRLALYLDQWESKNLSDNAITITRLTKEDAATTSKLSNKAHAISGDQVLSLDMTVFEHRFKLETALYEGTHGHLIEPATLQLSINNQMIGICSAVEVNCWGFEKAAWIFDMCIHPDFHGRGLGKSLFYKTLDALKDMQYPIVGLAVTEGNTYAEHLYETCGFFWVENFSEFGYPIQP
ncbi:MAG: GNAT family N-acetyltransferase [Candidatus Margulisbacteria bacterium]|nr:GNAT family N-acetyltransferase [Candidatus Margulisiibacteriota bacterium]